MYFVYCMIYICVLYRVGAKCSFSGDFAGDQRSENMSYVCTYSAFPKCTDLFQ